MGVELSTMSQVAIEESVNELYEERKSFIDYECKLDKLASEVKGA